MQVKIDIKGMKQFQNSLEKIAKLSEADLLMTVARPIENSVKESFENETDPWGNAWVNQDSPTFFHLDSGQNPKKKNNRGHMKESLHSKVNSAREVTVGINVQSENGYDYSAIQQFGSKKSSGRGSGIPARPFFPIDLNGNLAPDVERDIKEGLNLMLEGIFSS